MCGFYGHEFVFIASKDMDFMRVWAGNPVADDFTLLEDGFILRKSE